MTDALNEQLSACLDGELPPAELDLLLKRVGRDGELRAAIGRYSLIGESMRAERPAIASKDFASKVMAAVAAETQPAQAAPVRAVPRVSAATLRYLRPAAGMAVAAGVAAVAVLSVQQFQQPATAPALVADNTPNTVPVANAVDDGSSYVVPTSTTSSGFVPATRLTNYVVAHSEYSSPLGRRSVLTGVLAEDDETEAPVQITTESAQDDRIKVDSTADNAAPKR